VRANADDAAQAQAARDLGAGGIGLCRTEHMFFGPGKLEPMREMILARTAEERGAALGKLLPLQRGDFADLFRAMAGLPVTIRLLDPPLHEFVPHDEEGIARLAASSGLGVEEVRKRAAALAETNPMLGLRGCRLGITYPEITAMQARAVFEAACDVALEGLEVHPQIMVPLVADVRELQQQRRVIDSVANDVFLDRALRVPYHVGTMIEVPRAALTAAEIAGAAEFFSFGTNDLTQMAFGLSRDDVAPMLGRYLELGLLRADPFATLDREGVGELMRTAAANGRVARPELEIGICGEHGGDPDSIAFCHELGLDYVSCSPTRVPVARLAAAQAALRSEAAGVRPPSDPSDR
jgi:pyruvate,orthophosphate dikinase